MYAVILASGKQYKVSENDVLKIDKLDAQVGSVVKFDKVLALKGASGELRLGTPTVDGALVSAEVLEQKRDAKVIIFKKKRRHNYRRKNGHRQYVTVLRILDVSGKGSEEKKAVVKKLKEVSVASAENASETDAKSSPKKTAGDKSGKKSSSGKKVTSKK